MKELLKRKLRNLIGPPTGKKSYSQCGEDMILAHLFGSLGMNKITYLDIGAHDPYWLSNTAYFYKSGSNGINVEPNPKGFEEFMRHRKRDLNLNCGIADKDDELIFYVMNVPTVSTFSKNEAEDLTVNHGFRIVDQMTVKVQSISSILDKYVQGKFPDLLSLDVEGLDEKIIKSIDWEQSKPTAICLETISYSTNGMGKKNVDIINYLTEKGYMIYADTYVNTIFVLKNKWVRGVIY